MQVYGWSARPVVLLVALAGAVFLASSGPAQAQEQVTIAVGDFWFCDSSFQEGTCETVITAGDTVLWNLSTAITPHTTTDCGSSCDSPTASPLWDSGVVNAGGMYSFTFNSPGTYPYYCAVHPTLMYGRIVVQAAPEEPSPSPIADGTPQDTATPASPALADGALPRAGQGADEPSTPQPSRR